MPTKYLWQHRLLKYQDKTNNKYVIDKFVNTDESHLLIIELKNYGKDTRRMVVRIRKYLENIPEDYQNQQENSLPKGRG